MKVRMHTQFEVIVVMHVNEEKPRASDVLAGYN